MGVILSVTHKELLAKLIEELKANVAFGHAGDLMLEAARELENYLSFNVRRYGMIKILPNDFDEETAEKYVKQEAIKEIAKALIDDGIVEFSEVETDIIDRKRICWKVAVVLPERTNKNDNEEQ